MTYSGLPTLLAVSACCLVMTGRLQADTLRMRRIQLMAAPFGAAHDLLAGAWPCPAGALLAFATALAAYRREQRRRRGTYLAASGPGGETWVLKQMKQAGTTG